MNAGCRESWPLVFVVLFLCSSCAPMIAQQNVPVSSDPAGAIVLVDGQSACTTPCSVPLARNQDHILTLQKSGYRQRDVTVKRQYQSQKTLLTAINSGFNTGTFFNNAAMGMNSAVQSLKQQEETGEAYVLVPSTVSVALVPAAGFPKRNTEEEATESLQTGVSPLDYMEESDEQMLEAALESCPTGQKSVWGNEQTGFAFAVEPEKATTVNGSVVRYFLIGAKKGGDETTGRFPAYRVGRGEWAVGEPPPAVDAPAATASVPSGSQGSPVYRALGEAPWPSKKKEWTVNQSSDTQTEQRSDGSIVTKTKKSSVKVGVSASPASVQGILDALDSFGHSN